MINYYQAVKLKHSGKLEYQGPFSQRRMNRLISRRREAKKLIKLLEEKTQQATDNMRKRLFQAFQEWHQ